METVLLWVVIGFIALMYLACVTQIDVLKNDVTPWYVPNDTLTKNSEQILKRRRIRDGLEV